MTNRCEYGCPCDPNGCDVTYVDAKVDYDIYQVDVCEIKAILQKGCSNLSLLEERQLYQILTNKKQAAKRQCFILPFKSISTKMKKTFSKLYKANSRKRLTKHNPFSAMASCKTFRESIKGSTE